MNNNIRSFDIWLADLPRMADSSVQHGIRPVVVVSNNAANRFSPVITVVPLTSRLNKRIMPTHVYLQEKGLDRPSIALCEQVITLDKSRLYKFLGMVEKPFNKVAIHHSLALQLGMAA